MFWFLGGVGLFLTCLSVLITQFPQLYLPYPLNFTLFYEMAAYLFFIASPISLLYFARQTQRLFNAKTSRKFYEVMVQEISRSSGDTLNALLEILLVNFDAVCKAAVQQNSEVSDVRGNAISIIEVVLSDESVVRLLTTKRLDGLLYIFSVIEEHGLNRRHSGIGIPKILSNLFYDEESFFYKQLDEVGLALSSNVYRAIFESPVLLTNFDLFGFSTLGFSRRKDTGSVGIRVLIKALSKSIDTYLKTGDVPPRHINNGLEYLTNVFGDMCVKINIEEKRGIDTKYALKDEWWSLHVIAKFLGHDYPYLVHDEVLHADTVANERSAQEADFYSDRAINEGIAAALYKCLLQLSYIDKTADIYHTVLDLLHGMMYEGNLKEGYRQPFEAAVWGQIANNVIRRYYPAILRSYLTFIGFCLASPDPRAGWIGDQTERMRRLLYIDLKPLLDTDEKMVDGTSMKEALLPNSMDYKEDRFTYRPDLGRGNETIISVPAEGAVSAVADIDLEHLHLLL